MTTASFVSNMFGLNKSLASPSAGFENQSLLAAQAAKTANDVKMAQAATGDQSGGRRRKRKSPKKPCQMRVFLFNALNKKSPKRRQYRGGESSQVYPDTDLDQYMLLHDLAHKPTTGGYCGCNSAQNKGGELLTQAAWGGRKKRMPMAAYKKRLAAMSIEKLKKIAVKKGIKVSKKKGKVYVPLKKATLIEKLAARRSKH